jgi:hypothetical protein
VSDATFYAWKKKYAHLGVSERLRQVEEEHSPLKRLVTDLSLDKHMFSEALRKTVYGPHVAENWQPGFVETFQVSGLRACRLAQFSRAPWDRRSCAKDQFALQQRIRDPAPGRPGLGPTECWSMEFRG